MFAKLVKGLFSRQPKTQAPPPSLMFRGQKITPGSEETVLDALLGAGFPIPNSCHAGACQSCVLVTDQSALVTLPIASREPLTEAEQAQGMFLACCAKLTAPINVYLPSEKQHPSHQAKVEAIEPLNGNVVRLSLTTGFDYQPGQFINMGITNQQGHWQRSYSLASVPGLDEHLELQVKVIEGGEFSHWLQQSPVGQIVTLEGPHGHCFLTEEHLESKHLLLIGIGTGLAPLWGIVRRALLQNYSGSLHLIVAAREPEGLYLIDELQQLAQQNPQLHLSLLVQEAGPSGPWQQADIYEFVRSLDIDFSRAALFLAGSENFVQKMKKTAFMKGCPMRNINADAFIKS
ncbi:FAD-binding oxidoreductase [Halioxenophilus sp. WMMB6]|uniref:FAD-binding oxidoreductase n=1 Tax=Halioxenophilus sp. WMMB6 TaxID=3073815 RepID=UPI00295E9D4E|nr:FAD-binding oxidoreductase [Halioxenophilus sp. WMMB6]